jgi:hypothetical protein
MGSQARALLPLRQARAMLPLRQARALLPLPLAGEGWGEGSPPNILLGTAHIRGGELIPGRLLSPIEIQQIQRSQEPQSTP